MHDKNDGSVAVSCDGCAHPTETKACTAVYEMKSHIATYFDQCTWFAAVCMFCLAYPVRGHGSIALPNFRTALRCIFCVVICDHIHKCVACISRG